MLIFDVQYRLEAVVTCQQPKSDFEAKSSEQASLVIGMLPVQVEFRSPPLNDAVLELGRVTEEPIPAFRPACHSIVLNVETADLRHLTAIRDGVRFFGLILSETGLGMSE